MEGKPPRPNMKRQFTEIDDSHKPPPQKRVRFPKGKKVKQADYVVDAVEDVPKEWKDPHSAAKERSMHRNQITAELFDDENRGMLPDISKAEENYEDDETFEEDGIAIEPFNLKKEREEGYFDEQGNYVEYVYEKEIKDAWLDSVDVHLKFTGESSVAGREEEKDEDLSSNDIGKMKRRIADILEPGETVLRALRRLKGSSGNKKEKMSTENKKQFDQLTEDAMKLMENGEYDVYDEKQETFQREAEGYERLARAKSLDTSLNQDHANPGTFLADSLISNAVSSSPLNMDASTPVVNKTDGAVNDEESYDMFAEDDQKTAPNSNSSTIVHSDPNNLSESTSDLQDDYIYDENSGYYYSSSSGYYYDPSSGLYCCASSGLWYAYNEQLGTYDEVQQPTDATS